MTHFKVCSIVHSFRIWRYIFCICFQVGFFSIWRLLTKKHWNSHSIDPPRCPCNFITPSTRIIQHISYKKQLNTNKTKQNRMNVLDQGFSLPFTFHTYKQTVFVRPIPITRSVRYSLSHVWTKATGLDRLKWKRKVKNAWHSKQKIVTFNAALSLCVMVLNFWISVALNKSCYLLKLD